MIKNNFVTIEKYNIRGYKMDKLLLVDDDKEITCLLKELLELESFSVDIAYDGVEALEKFNETISLVLLDVMMPQLNGLSVLSQLRAKYTVPIILLTAKDNDIDKIIGLELGADDYIIKPFNDRELIARIRALLRRNTWRRQPLPSIDEDSKHFPDEYIIGKMRVNVKQQMVFFDEVLIDLTGTEFQILLVLLRNRGKVISRDLLSEKVLGKKFLPLARSVDVHVSNLRKKLPLRQDGLPWIKTFRSKGYLFIEDEDRM